MLVHHHLEGNIKRYEQQCEEINTEYDEQSEEIFVSESKFEEVSEMYKDTVERANHMMAQWVEMDVKPIAQLQGEYDAELKSLKNELAETHQLMASWADPPAISYSVPSLQNVAFRAASVDATSPLKSSCAESPLSGVWCFVTAANNKGCSMKGMALDNKAYAPVNLLMDSRADFSKMIAAKNSSEVLDTLS